jgi:hypothetical protein
MALWFAPRRTWIWIVGTQIAVEFAIDVVRIDHFNWRTFPHNPIRPLIQRTDARSESRESGNSRSGAL